MLALVAKAAITALPAGAITYAVESSVADSNIVTVIFPLLVVVLAGIFTIRSQVAKVYKENYEAKVEEVKVLTHQRDEEREKKHDALNDVASLKAQLQLERMKTDLTPLAEKMDAQTEVLEQIARTLLVRGTRIAEAGTDEQ